MVNAFRWVVFVIGLAVVIGSIMVTSAGYPIIKITSPPNGYTVYTDEITVSGVAKGTEDAPVESVTVKGVLAGGITSWHSKVISLQPGSNTITAVATDRSGKPGTATISVTYIDPTSTPTVTPISNGGHRPTSTPTPTPTPITMPTGSISITTIPTGAEVYWDDSFAGNASITLKDVVGHHRVKISKEGYCIVTRNIELYKDITTQKIFRLEPITGSIYISSTPSGACVYLDGVNMKANTTCKLSEVVVGNHTIKLTKSDYFDNVTRNVPVSNSCKPIELHVNLTGCGYINISSNSPGANVYLDGNYTGETTPKNISMVAVGNHTIKLTKLGYEDAILRNVSVSVGITQPVHINLTECGYINISSDPPGANVSVDGIYTGKTPTNINIVAQGNHTIKLTKSGYFDLIIRNISVFVGEKRHLHETLTGYGSLRMSSNPSGAKVYLDDDPKGITPLDISKVVEGSHDYKLTKSYHEDVENVIDVSAGKLTKVDVSLSHKLWVKWVPEILTGLAFFVGTFLAIFRWLIPRLSKEKYLLFCLDPSYRQHLKEGDVGEELKKVFKDNEQSISSEAKVSKIAEKQWQIGDGKMQYSIEDTEKRLDIYKKRNN